jgi:NADPH-dependent glutamate synthase beta subunit-like oxidoreductase
MTQAIIFINDNGGVSVCIPTGEISIEAVKAKDTPAGSIIVDQATLPNSDNDFFNAWELVNGKVEVSLAKAKEITRARLRAEREPLLQAQDVLFQRALETSADTTAIVAEKQRLRDITNQVDSATTTAQLRGMKVEA